MGAVAPHTPLQMAKTFRFEVRTFLTGGHYYKTCRTQGELCLTGKTLENRAIEYSLSKINY